MLSYTDTLKVADKSGAWFNSRLYFAIGDAVSELRIAQKDIVSYAGSIRGVLDNVQAKLSHTSVTPEGVVCSAALNRLGELRNTASDYDNAVITYVNAASKLDQLIAIAADIL